MDHWDLGKELTTEEWDLSLDGILAEYKAREMLEAESTKPAPKADYRQAESYAPEDYTAPEPEYADDPAPEYQPPVYEPEEDVRAYVPRKSSLPTEDDVRSFVSSYMNLKEEPVSIPAIEPQPEFDARFLMGDDYDYSRRLRYDGHEIDTSAAEGYSPAKAPEYVSHYAPDEASDEEYEEDDFVPPGLLGKLGFGKSKKSKKANKAEKKPRSVQPEEVPAEEEGEYVRQFKDYDAAESEYAEDDDYEFSEEPNEAAEFSQNEEFFPSSFKEYIFSVVTSLLYRLRGGIAGALTMEDSDEDLGTEVGAMQASKYYGAFIRSLRLRFRISLGLLVLMLWLSFGLPVPGMLKTWQGANMICLILQLCIMLLSLDVFTNGMTKLFRREPGIESLAAISCLLTSIDALLCVKAEFVEPHMALCAVSSLSMVGLLFASLLHCRAQRKSIRVPAIGKRAYTVTGETNTKNGDITLLKSLRPSTGFVRRCEEAAPDELFFQKAAVPVMVLALLLALIVAIAKKSYTDLVFIVSAVFCPAVPAAGLLCFSLPYFMGSMRIFSSGAAIAGWSGMSDIGRSKNLIVTDRDLFPEGTVELESVRIFADAAPERIISYAGSMLTASGTSVSSCFAELMKEHGCRMRNIENFEYLPGGGMKGVIDSSVVLCGSSDLMRLMNVRIPFRLVSKTSVLLAVDGILYGIFNMKYTPDPKVRSALVSLMRSNRHPVFAVRDFNVNPEMLHNIFDVATDGYDFPPYVERFEISSGEVSPDSKVSAVVCREGLGPLTHMADTGRSMYLATKLNVLLTALSVVIGIFAVWFKLLGGGVSLSYIFVFMLICAIPVGIISVFFKA